MALVRYEIKLDHKLLKWLDDTFPDSNRSHIITELLQKVQALIERNYTYEDILLHLDTL